MRARGLWEHPSQCKPDSCSLMEKTGSPPCTEAWPRWPRFPCPHGLGDSSYREARAGRKHRTHLHKALCFIYIIKETGWEGLGTHRKKASLQSYRCLLQSDNTNHPFLPRRNPPRTGVKRRSKVAGRIGRRASQMVQAVPGGQTAKLCAAHEGCSSVGLGAGEKGPLGCGQQITLRG